MTLSGAATLALLVNLSAQSGGVALKYGAPPSQPGARRAFAYREHGVVAALFFHGLTAPPGSRVYGLFCENLRYYSRYPLVGDWTGPNRYARLLAHKDDPAELYRRLRGMQADYLILPDTERWREGRLAKFEMPRPEQLASHFEVVYSDEFATLYRLKPQPEIAPRTP